MKTKIQSFGLVTLLMASLAGCFEYEATVHITKDGGGKAAFVYRIPPGLIDATDLDGKIPLTQKDVDARYRMRAGVTQYRSDFRDTEKFKEVRLWVDFDKIESLSERGNTFSYTIEGPFRVFRVRLDKQNAGVPEQSKEAKARQQMLVQKVLDRYKITYKVYLPGKIEQSNAQTVEWNAATWEIPLSVFLSSEKQVVILEAKTRVGLWERLKWRITSLFS